MADTEPAENTVSISDGTVTLRPAISVISRSAEASAPFSSPVSSLEAPACEMAVSVWLPAAAVSEFPARCEQPDIPPAAMTAAMIIGNTRFASLIFFSSLLSFFHGTLHFS